MIDPTFTHTKSTTAQQRRLGVIPGGVNSNVRLRGFPTPLTFTHGSGSHIWDVDGNKYIDYAMGMGPHILGHSPAVVVDSVRASLDRGQLFAGQCDEEGQLAEMLVEILPWVEHVRFGSSGTEMALLAVRVARAATGRQQVVRFVGHYHGWLDPLFVDPSPATVTSAAPLSAGQSTAAAADILMCPWNDVDALQRVFAEHATTIAAVLMEPIMCNTGVIEPLPGYLEAVRALCESNGSVLVIDEVITGFRVGLTGAQGRIGISGDLTVYAKAIASGYPVAALGGRADLLAGVGTGLVNHSGTYNTGVSQMVAAVATVQHLRDADPYPMIRATTRSLVEGIEMLASKHGIELVLHSAEAMFQIRFGADVAVTDAASFAADADQVRLATFLAELQSNGLRATSRGLFFVSSAHSERDTDTTLDAFDQALSRVGKPE